MSQKIICERPKKSTLQIKDLDDISMSVDPETIINILSDSEETENISILREVKKMWVEGKSMVITIKVRKPNR